MTIAQAEITLRQYNDRYCYDGDTCYVTVDGANTKIRLLELDTLNLKQIIQKTILAESLPI